MTVSAAACTRPGCTGTIDGGYCTVCGLAPPAAGPAVGPPAGGPAAAGPAAGGAAVPAQGAAPAGSGPAGPPGSAPSGAVSGSTGTWSGSVPSGTRRSRRGSSRSSRGRLGAGLVDIPPVPARDPAAAVLANPQVPASKRFCGSCERPVGRDRDGQPGLAEGYCPHCGTPFSFVPKLAAGELVGGQYEVLGCLAHGGLGWIYLGMDRHLGNRWVVLKGLLNSGDTAAQEAALAERRFLAEVEHPNIVGVYNFVEHTDRRTGEVAGYIVMEYVGGKSVKQILLERRQLGQSLPLPVALAYAIEVLPALGYLHSRGLVYCDFKPDNVIQTEEQLKLIDMGGVRRIDDADSAIYGTVGYQAPEIADRGPSPSSDLYTVGRTLAVLTFEFAGYQGRFASSLPDPGTVPVLAASESFLRALLRATDPDPDRRFASASEMAEQLTGVLREVLAMADQQPRPSFSTLFSPEVQTAGVPASQPDGQRPDGQPPDGQPRAGQPVAYPAPAASLIVAGLPVPQVDSTDPAAGYLATLSTLDPEQRTAALIAAVRGEQSTPAAVAGSPETQLALARSLIVGGDLEHASAVLSMLAGSADADWRTVWYQGLRELAAGQPGPAQAAFDTVCATLPGELAPKLALAFAAEAAADQGISRPVLPAGLDGGPVLCERRVRPGPDPAGQCRPGRGDRCPGRRAGQFQPAPGGADRRGPAARGPGPWAVAGQRG